MRIGIDARAWNWTGVGRYIRNLIVEFSQVDHKHTFLLFVPASGSVPDDIAAILKEHKDRFELQEVESRYYSWQEQTLFPMQIQAAYVDLFHFPHFNVPIYFPRPFVVTIHDTTRFVIPGQKQQDLLSQIAYELVFARSIAQAKRIICVSNNTENDLRDLPIKVDVPIQTIYEGVDARFSKEVSSDDRSKLRALLGTSDDYLLQVGVWMSHKNIPRLIDAFHSVLKENSRLKLVVTGKPVPKYSDLLRLVREYNLEDNVLFPGFVPDRLLPALYAEAKILVFPSLYEGFGLPAIEAASLGTPVVCSNVTSLPEVMGDAAHYVNPESADDIASGINKMMIDDHYRREMIIRGLEKVKRYSWRTCAESTLRVYETFRGT